MPPSQPTVGLVGSRNIDQGLQSSNKMTVTEFAFPSASRTPQQISIPAEGSVGNTLPKGGDCYADSPESTHMCAPREMREHALQSPLHHARVIRPATLTRPPTTAPSRTGSPCSCFWSQACSEPFACSTCSRNTMTMLCSETRTRAPFSSAGSHALEPCI